MEPGAHGAHGHDNMEHPQTEGRAPAGTGMLLTVPPSWQGVGRAPAQSKAQTTMLMSTTVPAVSVGSQVGHVPAQLPALPCLALPRVLSTSSANYLLH